MRTKDLRSLKRAFHIALPLALAGLFFVLVLGTVAAGARGSLTRITTATGSDRDSRASSLSEDGTVIAS